MKGTRKLLLYVSVVMLFPTVALAFVAEMQEPKSLGWKASFFATFSFIAFVSYRIRCIELRVAGLEKALEDSKIPVAGNKNPK